jgi:hypothetical protein
MNSRVFGFRPERTARWRRCLHVRVRSSSTTRVFKSIVGLREEAPYIHWSKYVTSKSKYFLVSFTRAVAKKLGNGSPGSAGCSSATHPPLSATYCKRCTQIMNKYLPTSHFCFPASVKCGKGRNGLFRARSGRGMLFPGSSRWRARETVLQGGEHMRAPKRPDKQSHSSFLTSSTLNNDKCGSNLVSTHTSTG